MTGLIVGCILISVSVAGVVWLCLYVLNYTRRKELKHRFNPCRAKYEDGSRKELWRYDEIWEIIDEVMK